MVGKQWPTPGLPSTPVQDVAAQVEFIKPQLQVLHASVVIRAQQWEDMEHRISVALAATGTSVAQLKALIKEAHARLAKGW